MKKKSPIEINEKFYLRQLLDPNRGNNKRQEEGFARENDEN